MSWHRSQKKLTLQKKSPTQIFHKMTIIISILLTLWYLCIKLPRNKYKFPCSSSFTDGVVYRKTWVSSRKKNFVSFPCQILNNWILLQLELARHGVNYSAKVKGLLAGLSPFARFLKVIPLYIECSHTISSGKALA